MISYGGDPASSADCEIVGNYIGYLRFGVEMLKAAIAEPEPRIGINISVSYMEIARWGLRVKKITRREDVTSSFDRDFAAKFPPRSWKNNLTMSGEIFLGIFAVLCLLVGLGEIIGWVLHWLF